MSSNIRNEFRKRVKNLENYVALIVINAKNYQKASNELLKYIVGVNNLPGVYITLNKPYDIIIREMKASGIDDRLIIFIDGITKITAGKKTKTENCLFIGSPEKLSDLFVALDQAINSISINDKFVVLDSVNTLELFNSSGTVARFAHQLVARMRAWKIKGIIFTLPIDNDILINELRQFCDVQLELR